MLFSIWRHLYAFVEYWGIFELIAIPWICDSVYFRLSDYMLVAFLELFRPFWSCNLSCCALIDGFSVAGPTEVCPSDLKSPRLQPWNTMNQPLPLPNIWPICYQQIHCPIFHDWLGEHWWIFWRNKPRSSLDPDLHHLISPLRLRSELQELRSCHRGNRSWSCDLLRCWDDIQEIYGILDILYMSIHSSRNIRIFHQYTVHYITLLYINIVIALWCRVLSLVCWWMMMNGYGYSRIIPEFWLIYVVRSYFHGDNPWTNHGVFIVSGGVGWPKNGDDKDDTAVGTLDPWTGGEHLVSPIGAGWDSQGFQMSSLWLEEIMQLGSKKTHIVDVEIVQQHTTAKMVCKACCKAQTQLPLGMSEARWQWSQRLLGVLFVCRNTMAKQFQIGTCYTIPFKVLRPPRVVTYTPPPVTAATVPLTTNVPAQARDDWHGWWWHVVTLSAKNGWTSNMVATLAMMLTINNIWMASRNFLLVPKWFVYRLLRKHDGRDGISSKENGWSKTWRRLSKTHCLATICQGTLGTPISALPWLFGDGWLFQLLMTVNGQRFWGFQTERNHQRCQASSYTPLAGGPSLDCCEEDLAPREFQKLMWCVVVLVNIPMGCKTWSFSYIFIHFRDVDFGCDSAMNCQLR